MQSPIIIMGMKHSKDWNLSNHLGCLLEVNTSGDISLCQKFINQSSAYIITPARWVKSAKNINSEELTNLSNLAEFTGVYNFHKLEFITAAKINNFDKEYLTQATTL